MEIIRFDPDDAANVRAALEVRNGVEAVDAPWERPMLLEDYVELLRHGWDGEPVLPSLVRESGQTVAIGSESYTERENLHLASLTVRVHPDHRRRGHGTALLEHLVEQARAAGRSSIGIDGWQSEACTGFAARHELDLKSQEIARRQHLAELGPGVVDRLYGEAARASEDYELVRIAGRTPDDLLEAVAEVSAAINDAPTDDLDIEDDVMTPDRVIGYETAVMSRGHRIYRLLARHRGSGELGGHTVVAVDSRRPTYADQHDTAVMRAHRGHRLGLLLKAGMLQWLAEAEPELETIDTWNAESNDHMIGVNERLGYRVMGRVLDFQKAV